MSNQLNIASKKPRLSLKSWQKLLLIAGVTALCGLMAWLYCEKIATPSYVVQASSSLTIEDTESLVSSEHSSFTDRQLDILGALKEELSEPGSKQRGNKALLYYNLTADLQEKTGQVTKPKDLKSMIRILQDPQDATGQTILITTIKMQNDAFAQQLARSAAEQLCLLTLGDAAADTALSQITLAPAAAGEDVSGADYQASLHFTDAAVQSLPDKFFGMNLDLALVVDAIEKDDAVYQRILDAAQVNAKPQDLRKRLRITNNIMTLNFSVSWSADTQDAATRLSSAAMDETAKLIYGGAYDPWQVSMSEVKATDAVKEWPQTLPIVLAVTLLALVISFCVFSRQPLFDSLIILFFVLFTFICVFPFYYLFINTISDNNLVAGGQINFIPRGLHLANYTRILKGGELVTALGITVARTVLGTALMVITSAWAGYLVTKQKMWHRSFWYRALVITMYFNAGLIPWYTNMLMLGLTGNFLAYIIPGMVAPYNIILVKTYIESIPGSLEESAIIDGASTTKVFLRIILPLSIPILATISIFGAVGNWNSFQDSLLLMSSTPSLYTLQHRLYIYLNQTTSINTEQISEQMAQNLLNNGVTTKYTIAMVTIIPILLVYPFMQRYFVKGIMLGAVKG